MSLVADGSLPTRRRKSVRPKMSETDLQKALVRRLQILAYPDVLYMHIPNGEARDPRIGAKLKTMGVLAGAADLLLLRSGRVLFLELKAKSGRRSDAQVLFGERAIQAGATYAIAYGLDAATRVLVEQGFMRNAEGLLPKEISL